MDSNLTELAALELAVRRIGGQSATARRRGVSQPTVHNWLHKAKKCPPEHVLGMEADSRVSRHDLRPDLYPREEANPTPSAPPLIAPTTGAEA
jgi:DNA-binding transcriptional regulator YdaS (Cro superfamily)